MSTKLHVHTGVLPKIIEGISPEVELTPVQDGFWMTVTTKTGSKRVLLQHGKDYVLTEEDIEEIGDRYTAIKTAAEAARDAAQAAASQAETTAGAAAGYSAQAERQAGLAGGFASAAATQATAAAASASIAATKASDASTYAAAANSSATSASSSASAASASASEAASSATAAETSKASAASKASEAAASADAARTKAQEAGTSAQQILGMTVSATGLPAGSTPTVQASEVDGHKHLTFGLVPGNPGADGYSPVRGTDYWTAADQRAVVEEAAEQIAIYSDIDYTPLASFADGADGMPLRSLSVAIEPVQDLHGQDAPYSAGGGKNLLDDSKKVFNNKSVILGTDSISGISCELPAGTYTFSVTLSSGTTTNLYAYNPVSGANISGFPAYGASQKTFTLSESTSIRFWVYDDNASSVDFVKTAMVESGSTATAYAPYSNICPISGWTGANVSRTGINLLLTDKGQLSATAVGINTKYANSEKNRNGYPTYLKSGTYTISFKRATSANSYGVYYREVNDNANTTIIGSNTTDSSNATFTISKDGWYRFWIFHASGVSVNDIDEVMLVRGSNVADYVPYNGNIFSISFPSSAGTVYGGTLTIHQDGSGELVVDHAFLTDNGSLNWLQNADGSFFVANPGSAAMQDTDGCACNYAPFVIGFGGFKVFFRVNGLISLGKDWGNIYATADDLKAAFASVPIQFVYKLATPVTYTFTAEQIKTLLGVNNVWADTGNVSLLYPADTKSYIDNQISNTRKLIAGIETEFKASKAYSVGDMLIIGNDLYKVSASIASGATITVGTNVTKTTVAEQLIALANA